MSILPSAGLAHSDEAVIFIQDTRCMLITVTDEQEKRASGRSSQSDEG
jgi:hypothetical protein